MIFKFNQYELYFNSEHLGVEGEGFKMDNDTSYVEKFVKMYKTSKQYREALLPLKLQCLLNIKDVIGGRYNTYLDLLAGIGISGKIFHEKRSQLNDFCPICFDILNDNFAPKDFSVSKLDMFDFPWYEDDYDFIFADFNNFTFKRYLNEYKVVVNSVFRMASKYVLINDCSIFYLKYGKVSYEVYSKLLGKTINNLDEYYLAIKDYFRQQYPEWSLVIVEAFKDTSFLLFTKDIQEGLQVNHNTKEHLTVKTELI